MSDMCKVPSTLSDTPVGRTITETVVTMVSTLTTHAGDTGQCGVQSMNGFVSWPWYFSTPGEQWFHLFGTCFLIYTRG